MPTSSKRQIGFFIGCGLVLATTIVFGQVVTFDFTNFDDPEYVLECTMVQGGLRLAGLAEAFTAFRAANWHPLTWLSLMADRQFFGPGAWGFHLTNLVLHMASVLVLFVALRHMTGALWRSALVAALFAVHPLHVESVAWISERKDVLSTFFWMLVLWSYSHYATGGSRKWYGLVIVFFSLGLMAKPMVVTLPCVLLLLDYWPLRRVSDFRWNPDVSGGESATNAGNRDFQLSSRIAGSGVSPMTCRQLIVEKVPLFAMTLAACAVTLFAQRSALGTSAHFPLGARFSNCLLAYVAYLEKMAWPTRLSNFYLHLGNRATTLTVASSALVLGVISWWACRNATKKPWILVGWLWYLGTLVPVIGLVQVGSQGIADRYTYIPLVGVFLTLAWSIPVRISNRLAARSAIVVALSSILVALVVRAYDQTGNWRNSFTLYAHALSLEPNDWLAHVNLGRALEDRGESEAAFHHYQAGWQLNADSVAVHMNLAAVYDRQGNLEGTLYHCGEAVRCSPRFAQAHNNFGLAWVKAGHFPNAIEQFRLTTQLAPRLAEGHRNLAAALLDSGNLQQAVVEYVVVVRLIPNDPAGHTGLGTALAASGDRDAARSQFDEALRLDPDYLPARQSLHELLGWSYRSSGLR